MSVWFWTREEARGERSCECGKSLLRCRVDMRDDGMVYIGRLMTVDE